MTKRLGEDSWSRYVVERLDKSWRDVGLEPTEVDFAFFLDRAIHMGWGASRFAAVRDALRSARLCLSDKAFTNARARLIVADQVRAKAATSDRLARDGIFLSTTKGRSRRRWRIRQAGRVIGASCGVCAPASRPADFGLSDERPAPRFAGADSL